MRVLAAIKEVTDPAIPIHLFSEGPTLHREAVPGVINPFDEIALEEAIRLKEQGIAQEVMVVGAGPETWEGTLRTALAMGADRALLMRMDPGAQPLEVARGLAFCAREYACDLILMGRQGVDCDHGVTAPMTAGMLGWPQATFVSRIEFDQDRVTVMRSVEGGQERLQLSLPAVISVDLGLNTPRYASLPNIMKARAKPVEVLSQPRLQGVSWKIAAFLPPPARPAGRQVASVEELVEQLDRAGVLP
ncbi:MAG: electron transfer flavoprotein subunit beta/FixA family protein [Magnetococcales bacterium]|nr:electron transfer flavoprotein subunit beta/FixA family protein [Magnetococcales bacterium]